MGGFNHSLYPLAGTFDRDEVLVMGTFTTDANGNVTSVSGLRGACVSGTALSSGVYTLTMGTGATDVGTAFAATGPNVSAADKIGKPLSVDSYSRLSYVKGDVVLNNTIPTSWRVQTTRMDGPAGVCTLQLLKLTASAEPAPALFPNGIVQVVLVGTFKFPGLGTV
jgi:hypothetical protein